MDDKTFDSLLKLSVTSSGRRRLLQAAGAAGIWSFLQRAGAAAQDVGVAACTRLQAPCSRQRQCVCRSQGVFNVQCSQLKPRCKNGRRCCGTQDTRCNAECDCCRGFTCRGGRCSTT